MQDQTTMTTVETVKKPKVRAQKKHVWMFAFVCAILILGILAQILGIVGLMEYLEYINADYADHDPSQDAIPGLGTLIMGFSTLLIMVVGLYASVFLRDAVWAVGLVLSIKLVRRKKEIPTWMWVISLILMIIYIVYIGSDVLSVLGWLFFSLLSKVISLF
ncbi:MAG: hypothetical protein IKB28_05055 [Clostridia bacterium]|nr:hypothetical protein [Clostridia bacterium]